MVVADQSCWRHTACGIFLHAGASRLSDPHFRPEVYGDMLQHKFVLAAFGGPIAYLFQSPPHRKVFVSNSETGIFPSATVEDENVQEMGAICSRLLLTKNLMSFII